LLDTPLCARLLLSAQFIKLGRGGVGWSCCVAVRNVRCGPDAQMRCLWDKVNLQRFSVLHRSLMFAAGLTDRLSICIFPSSALSYGALSTSDDEGTWLAFLCGKCHNATQKFVQSAQSDGEAPTFASLKSGNISRWCLKCKRVANYGPSGAPLRNATMCAKHKEPVGWWNFRASCPPPPLFLSCFCSHPEGTLTGTAGWKHSGCERALAAEGLQRGGQAWCAVGVQ